MDVGDIVKGNNDILVDLIVEKDMSIIDNDLNVGIESIEWMGSIEVDL